MNEFKENKKITFKVIWNALMSLVYFVLAYLIGFTPFLLPYNLRQGDPDTDDFLIARVILASAFLLYGIYRGYNVIKFKK